MKQVSRLITFLVGIFILPLAAQPCLSSYPYISGDTFRSFCTFRFDPYESFDPEHVKPADTIFVNTGSLAYFFNTMHARIACPYILVTHNNDTAVPGKFIHYLDDEKIIAWFGQNVALNNHPKMKALPIGMANLEHTYGNVEAMDNAIELSNQIAKSNDPKKLLYMNFKRSRNRGDRDEVFKLFYKKSFCSYGERKDYKDYLTEMSTFKFVLSPEGYGMDCYRTWEAILVGCIPVVKSSPLDPLFEDLPVVIVSDWKKVTKTFLDKKYKELTDPSQQYNVEKLYVEYWLKQIQAVQDEFKAQHSH